MLVKAVIMKSFFYSRFKYPWVFNNFFGSIGKIINSDDQFKKLEEVLAVGVQDDIFDENFAQEIKTSATTQMAWFKNNEINIRAWFARVSSTE